MLTRLAYTILMCLVIPMTSLSQGSSDELIDQYLEEAKSLNQEGRYEEANVKFRKILALNQVIPSEMCYHFAETLYAIGQYQNSKNFVTKYFDLTGTSGENYREVKKLESMIDEQLIAIRECHRCSATGYRYFPCRTCGQTGEVNETCYYCKGVGVSSCVKCRGNGVLISTNALGGRTYNTCDRCNGASKETCPICEGKTVISKICPECDGSTFETSEEICDHIDHPEDGFIIPYIFEKAGN